MKQFFILLLFSVFSLSAVAQQGTVRGILVDQDTNEALIGGIVQESTTGSVAVTDIDGSYSIQLPVGVYSITHTYIGYQDKTVTDVEILEGQVNALGNVGLGMGGEGSELEAVVVTAYVQKNTEEGLLNFQRNSTKIVDAISSQSIAKTGDSDVAAVVKRVPGVTVEGGKYVYVRGLGDRYSKSIVNGMEIPGLDPERNTVQMDIFSSNLIDNIVVYKTFSPDLAGDFTGGMVDVVTKDFPLEKNVSFGAGFGYNSQTTFNDNYIGYGGSSFKDALGFGKSSREIPVSPSFRPSIASDAEIFEVTNSLNKDAAVFPTSNFLNSSLNFSYGNQFDIKENHIGLTAAVNYKNDYSQKANWRRNDIVFLDGQEDLSNSNYRAGSVGGNDGMLNGLLNTAYKFDSGKVGLKLMHTRTGETNVSYRNLDDQFDNQKFDESIIDYFQRTITNAVLSSDLYFGEEQDKILELSASATRSTIDNPERTSSVMFIDPEDQTYTFASNSDFTKEWRDLVENNYNGKVDYTLPFLQKREQESTLKFGGAYQIKNRDFEPVQIEIGPSNYFDPSLSKIPNNDLDYILQTENIVNENHSGYGINAVKIDQENKFNSDLSIAAGYGMTNFAVNNKLKFIGGLRVEHAVMNFDGFVSGEAYQAETLNSTQLLPSANLMYEYKENMNFRTSYNRTLARPSFKEKSTVNIFDAILNQFYLGNIDLVETKVDNFDFRWEYYLGSKELISLSPFYKRFQDPIELSFINADQVKPINKNDADVIGVEFELRKNFGFVSEKLENLSLNSNFTYVNSSIPFTNNELLKYNNTDVPNSRAMVGQAPFTVNAGLSYGAQSGWETSMNYNVKGKTLNIVGFSTQTYDVYEDPFHNLDFKLSKKFNNKLGSKISLTASNLLGDNIDYYYDFRGKEVGVFNSYDIGRSFSVGYAMDIK